MTVEAAFIVPWVFFIMCWMIYMGYFQYDRCLAFQDNYAIASMSAAYIAPMHEKQNRLNGYSQRTKNKYIGVNNVSTSGTVSSNKVQMFTSFSVKNPVGGFESIIPARGFNGTDTVNADNYSFTKRLRAYRTVGRVINGGK